VEQREEDGRHESRLSENVGILNQRNSYRVLDSESLLWIVRQHHVKTFWEIALFVTSAGVTLFVAALLWVLYVGLEPFVRRRWPHVLVSWTRVLAGAWRDPLVAVTS
jgi:hypothetical protein